MPEAGNGHRLWGIAEVLHTIEIAVLLLSLGATYERLQAAAVQVGTLTDDVTRIEHYLSSKDSSYWKLSRENR